MESYEAVCFTFNSIPKAPGRGGVVRRSIEIVELQAVDDILIFR